MADFGKILEEWDRRAVRDFRRPGRSGAEEAEAREREELARRESSRRTLERAMLDTADPARKQEEDSEPPRFTKAEIEALPIEAVLDLHGLSAAAAEESLSLFFRDAASRGLAKVLIIHGKGHHSEGEPVLKKTVRDFLETSPLAGRHGTADRRRGGSGAVWVMVRTGAQRSR